MQSPGTRNLLITWINWYLIAGCIFIDYEKAFSCVCRNKLLIKLSAYSINVNF